VGLTRNGVRRIGRRKCWVVRFGSIWLEAGWRIMDGYAYAEKAEGLRRIVMALFHG